MQDIAVLEIHKSISICVGIVNMENHHIIDLSKGGEDSIDNCVALCPNCHQKMHLLDLKDDRKKLLQEARKSCCQLTIDGGVVYV